MYIMPYLSCVIFEDAALCPWLSAKPSGCMHIVAITAPASVVRPLPEVPVVVSRTQQPVGHTVG